MSDHSLLLPSPPAGWCATTFGDLCDRVIDTASPVPGGERLYLGLEHLASGHPKLVGSGRESDVRSGKTQFRKGDVLFGKLRPYLRKSVVARSDGICSTDILVFRPKSSVSSDFLCFLTHTREFIEHAKATMSGVQHPRTSWPALSQFQLHAPPIEQQHEIASVLCLVQEGIEKQDRVLQLTAELKAALLQKLFTRGSRSARLKRTDLGDIPVGWSLERLGDLLTIRHGYAFEGELFSSEGRYVVLTPGHFRETGGFRDQGAKTKYYTGTPRFEYVLERGDLLVVMTEQTPGLLGSALLVPQDKLFLHNQRLGLVQDLDEARLSKSFLYHFLSSPLARMQISRTASGSKVRHTSPTKLSDITIPLPSCDEQHDIVHILDTLDAKREVAQRALSLLTDSFQSCTNLMMSGQISIGADAPPGSRSRSVAGV